jgi:hypothetical protein
VLGVVGGVPELKRTRRRLRDELGRTLELHSVEKKEMAHYLGSTALLADLDDKDEARLPKSPPLSARRPPLRNNFLSPGANRKRARPLESPTRQAQAGPPSPTATGVPQDKAKVKFDLLPILTSSGESAFEVGLSKVPPPSKHLLPVFRLPTVTSTDFINRIPRDDTVSTNPLVVGR